MDEGRSVGVNEGKDVKRNDPIKSFLPTGSEAPFESQRGGF